MKRLVLQSEHILSVRGSFKPYGTLDGTDVIVFVVGHCGTQMIFPQNVYLPKQQSKKGLTFEHLYLVVDPECKVRSHYVIITVTVKSLHVLAEIVITSKLIIF